MGYFFAHSPCFGCKRLFSYHPHRVPSINYQGVRQPICLNCVNIANPRRVEAGLAPITVLPGAYEPAEESELSE